MLGAKAVNFIVSGTSSDRCRLDWRGNTANPIRQSKYLYQLAQNCKPGQVDPFFTKTGSNVGLAWLKNDSTQKIVEPRQAARLNSGFKLKPNEGFFSKVIINENDN